MKINRLTVLLGIAFSLTVFAVVEKVERSGSAFPLWLEKGLYIGKTTSNPTANVTNKITQMGMSFCSWDFPAIGTTGVDGLQGCAVTSSCAVTGAKFGDGCEMTDNMGSDGGATLDPSVTFECKVISAGNVMGKACAHQSDGGQVNLPDASYWFYTRSAY